MRVLLPGVCAWAGDRTFPRHGQQGQSFVSQIGEWVSRWSQGMGGLSPTSNVEKCSNHLDVLHPAGKHTKSQSNFHFGSKTKQPLPIPHLIHACIHRTTCSEDNLTLHPSRHSLVFPTNDFLGDPETARMAEGTA